MNTKKKILFLVTQSEFGGAQRFIYNLVTALRRYTQIEPRAELEDTQIDADKRDFLYSDITYKIRGACFKIWKEFRGAFKEKVIERALAKELHNQRLTVDTQKQILVLYDNEKIGKYVPDMVVDDRVLVELKSKTFLIKEDEKQFWLYLKGSDYRLGLLINFGKKLEIKRKIYDTAREQSALISVLPKAQNQRVSANYEVVVGAGPEGNDEKGLLFALEKEGINTINLKYLRRGVNPFFDFFGLVEIHKLIRKEKPDILFLCSSKAGFLGSLAAHLYRGYTYQRKSAYSSEARLDQRLSAKSPKVIYRIGGWTFNDPWPDWKKKFYLFLEKKTAKFKDVIINNAESDKKQAIKLGIKPKDKIVTIYNGIDTDKSEFLSREEAKKFLQFENSDFVVGTIANNYPAKGIEYFNKATKDFKNIKTIVIGRGNRYIPDAFRYLKAFDIFVLPSIKEGFPWVVLEAMAAEVPIIATRVGALPEIIEDNKNGILINPAKPEELAEAIKKLAKNKDLREKLSKEGRKTVIEKFSIQKMVSKFEELFI